MNRRRLRIRTLKYPLWFNILFSCLTILAPIVLIIIEGLKAPVGVAGSAFKLSFMTVVTGILVWIILKKTWIDKLEIKLLAKQVALEHDYSIDNGNPDKIKYFWYKNEIILTLFKLIMVALYGGLFIIILLGVNAKLMEVKGLVMILAILYIIAYTLKFVVLLIKSGLEELDCES